MERRESWQVLFSLNQLPEASTTLLLWLCHISQSFLFWVPLGHLSGSCNNDDNTNILTNTEKLHVLFLSDSGQYHKSLSLEHLHWRHLLSLPFQHSSLLFFIKGHHFSMGACLPLFSGYSIWTKLIPLKLEGRVCDAGLRHSAHFMNPWPSST